MKNLFLIASAVCLSIMISGCDNDGGYASISWKECSVTYTFLNYFPEYDGDIENAYYVNDNEGETLMFCDYDVDRENVNTFKNRLISSGFIEESTSGGTLYYYNNTGTYNLRVGLDDFDTYIIVELTVLP